MAKAALVTYFPSYNKQCVCRNHCALPDEQMSSVVREAGATLWRFLAPLDLAPRFVWTEKAIYYEILLAQRENA